MFVTCEPAIGESMKTCGGVVSLLGACVVAFAATDDPETLPAASNALTVYVYNVLGVSPVLL
jgi:hypothetical protein